MSEDEKMPRRLNSGKSAPEEEPAGHFATLELKNIL